MAYELYVLPVPPGGDVEESGEALLALEQDGLLTADPSDEAARRVDAVVDALQISGLGFKTDRRAEGVRLHAPSGLQVGVTTRFVRFRVPFDRDGEAARHSFDELFDLISRTVRETGWKVYDPQDARAVTPDRAGCQATLDIYLSAMDQIRPGPYGGTPA